MTVSIFLHIFVDILIDLSNILFLSQHVEWILNKIFMNHIKATKKEKLEIQKPAKVKNLLTVLTVLMISEFLPRKKCIF
jgi:hypothetical protein